MAVWVKFGFDVQFPGANIPVVGDFTKTPHLCIVGGTGSGKSMLTLYVLFSLLRLPMPVELYIGDFKKSGDYKGITQNFAEFDTVVDLVDEFYTDFENTPEGNQTVKILLLDEYAGFVVWLTQKDKKKCEEIKGKISNLLMLGRSRNIFVITVMQRFSSQLFPAGIGAKDNFGIVVGLGRLSVEGRTALFAGEHFEDAEFEANFRGGQGVGLCLIDGQPLHALAVPRISDKDGLKRVLRGYAGKK